MAENIEACTLFEKIWSQHRVLEHPDGQTPLYVEVGREYPDVELSHLYIDAASMMLILAPKQFDVIVTGNVFGEILSDAAAMLTGSNGMLPSASMGTGTLGLFEPVHGSASDVGGKDLANPLASILCSAMLLRYSLSLPEEADRIEQAVRWVLAAGYRTGDIFQDSMKRVGTSEMGDVVVAALVVRSTSGLPPLAYPDARHPHCRGAPKPPAPRHPPR